MNAADGNPGDALHDPRDVREASRMLFTVGVLEQRTDSDVSGYLWRIKLKVARHMLRVLARRCGASRAEVLPDLGPDEQAELLETHPLLQPDPPGTGPVGTKPDWGLAIELKVARFAQRMRSRQSGSVIDRV